jgi:hypothetical protein
MGSVQKGAKEDGGSDNSGDDDDDDFSRTPTVHTPASHANDGLLRV